ncbi:hypothetical protein KJ713_02500 [Patescibacteria group bacterium]|nr:hypothetical protein [Patescibacteria group bacterium]
MALTKNDLNQIRTVVKEEVGEKVGGVEKKVDGLNQKIDSVEKRLTKKIDQKIDGLALITKKGFDGQDEKINYLTKEVKEMRKDLVVHDFKMTEMVHKADYYKLEERVSYLERKTGIKV